MSATATLLPLSSLTNLFRKLGAKSPEQWSKERWQAKLKQLPEHVADDGDAREAYNELTEQERAFCDTVVSSVVKGEELDIDGLDGAEMTPANKKRPKAKASAGKVAKAPAKGEPKTQPSAVKTTPKGQAKVKGKPVKEETKAPRKASGDTNTGKILACLSKKIPKKMRQLTEEAGVEGTYYNYLNDLVEKGTAKKVPEGYLLA